MQNNEPNDLELFARHINHLFDKGEKQVTLDVEYLHWIVKQLDVTSHTPDEFKNISSQLDKEVYVTGGKFKE